MTTYNFTHSHKFFNMTIPSGVIEVINMFKFGECGKFHFICEESIIPDDADLTAPLKRALVVRSKLTVMKLPDGSWNMTNSESEVTNQDGAGRMKKIYIVETPVIQPESPKPTENAERMNSVSLPEATEKDEGTEGTTTSDTMGSPFEPENLPAAEHNIDVNSQYETIVQVVNEDVKNKNMDEFGLIDHDYISVGTGADGSSHVTVRPSEDESVDDFVEAHCLDVTVRPSEDESVDDFVEAHCLDEESEGEKRINIVTLLEEYGKGADRVLSKAGRMKKVIYHKRYRDKSNPACPICGALAKDDYNLMKHLKRQHVNDERLEEEVNNLKPRVQKVCKTCGRAFINCKTLREHIMTVHQEFQGIECPQCLKTYRTKFHLNAHIKAVHLQSEKKVQCDKCPKSFKTLRVLKTHILYHHTKLDRVYKCDQCPYTYAFQKQYYEHKTRVHGPKKQICQHCGYKCATRWYMKKHQNGCCRARQRELSIQALERSSKSSRVRSSAVTSNVADYSAFKLQEELATHTDVTEAMVKIEQKEEEDITLPGVDIPLEEWNVVLGNVDGEETMNIESDMEVEDTIVVKPEETYQQLTVSGPDGTVHHIQLVLPSHIQS